MEEDVYYIVLTHLKDLEKNYTTYLTEASSDELYEEFKKDLLSIADFQRKIFNEMNEKGYYKLKYMEKKDAKNLYDELNKKYNRIES